jgi:alpha-L-rhamnosidase
MDCSDFSESEVFIMAQHPFYDAKYIKAQTDPSEFSLYDPLPLFRREFELSEDVEQARIFVQSPGFASYYINGKNITEDIFISAVSNYDKILWYNEYDVTSLLKKGKKH